MSRLGRSLDLRKSRYLLVSARIRTESQSKVILKGNFSEIALILMSTKYS